MGKWKGRAADFFLTVNPPVFGAGFKKNGVDVSSHPRLVSFDGNSCYFSGLTQSEAALLLDGVTLLNGYTGWLAYMLQEVFYEDLIGDRLYEEIFDRIDAGLIKKPLDLSRESIYKWVESTAREVEDIKSYIISQAGKSK